MAIRGLWCSLLPVYLSVLAMATALSRRAESDYKAIPEQTRNKRVVANDAKSSQIVAYFAVDPPDLEGGYISIRDTEQHSNVIANTSKLIFTLHTPKGERTLLTYGTYDSLVAMRASRYSSMVFTGWEGGAHEAMKIFQLRKDGVRLVFEAASRQMPEVVWDGAGILVSRGYLMKGERNLANSH